MSEHEAKIEGLARHVLSKKTLAERRRWLAEFEDKHGVGISYFYIEPHSLMSKYYQLMIKRIDGTETDFSWIYCC